MFMKIHKTFKNAKIHLFEEENGFERRFKKMKCLRLTTGLVDLKNTKQLYFCLW